MLRIPISFNLQCKALDLPIPAAEFRFHQTRKWRADFAWPDRKWALEVEGGAFTNGRHTRGAGFVADMEKYNELSLAGYRILRVTPQQIDNGEAVELARRALTGTAAP